MSLCLIQLHNKYFTMSENCWVFLVLQWWRNKCLKACCEHQAAHSQCTQGGRVLIPVIHEVTQHNQNPLIQVFVGGKLFFPLCMQQTATNLSSTLHLLFYASSDHTAVLLPTYFFYLKAGHRYKLWLLWRPKEENLCSNAIVSNQHWGIKNSGLQQNCYGVSKLGSFYYPQQWSAMALGSFLSRSCCLETKPRKFRHQGELPRVIFKKSEQMES